MNMIPTMDEKTVVLYPRNWVWKGQMVPLWKVEEKGFDSPDFYVHRGTVESLTASALSMIDQDNSNSMFQSCCGYSILAAINRIIVFVVVNGEGNYISRDCGKEDHHKRTTNVDAAEFFADQLSAEQARESEFDHIVRLVRPRY